MSLLLGVWPGCKPVSHEDLFEVKGQLDTMDTAELCEIARTCGAWLIGTNPTREMLIRAIRRKSL